MTTVLKFTNPQAAGVEVDARAKRYASEHSGVTYKEAVNAVLAADKGLAQAYAEPARRVATKPADTRSQPAGPDSAPGDDEEIFGWIMRALADNMAGWLPGALGDLSTQAEASRETGMPIEEAAKRAMESNPAMVALAKALLVDIRRKAPRRLPMKPSWHRARRATRPASRLTSEHRRS